MVQRAITRPSETEAHLQVAYLRQKYFKGVSNFEQGMRRMRQIFETKPYSEAVGCYDVLTTLFIESTFRKETRFLVNSLVAKKSGGKFTPRTPRQTREQIRLILKKSRHPEKTRRLLLEQTRKALHQLQLGMERAKRLTFTQRGMKEGHETGRSVEADVRHKLRGASQWLNGILTTVEIELEKNQ